MKAEFITEKPILGTSTAGEAIISFKANLGAIESLEALNGESFLVSVSTIGKDRTLSQNGYMWELVGEIGKSIGLPKEEVYRKYLKDYGKYISITIPHRDTEGFARYWESKGIGWMVEMISEGANDTLLAYAGSSSYTREEMDPLMEAIVSDCREMGLPTMGDSDISLLENANGK